MYMNVLRNFSNYVIVQYNIVYLFLVFDHHVLTETPGDLCAKVNCSHPVASCQVVNETATCVCPQVVTLEYFPVCGSDGVTYPNPGSLGIASCNSGGAIEKVKDGRCKCDLKPDCQLRL